MQKLHSAIVYVWLIVCKVIIMCEFGLLQTKRLHSVCGLGHYVRLHSVFLFLYLLVYVRNLIAKSEDVT